MINLLSYFSPESVIMLQDDAYSQLMEQLVDHCLSGYSSDIRGNILAEIRSKSRSSSPQDINLGRGFALIHAKTDEVHDIRTALGILPHPRKLLKGERIRSIFCIILPPSESREYLSLLARLGRMLRQKDAPKAFESASKLFRAGDSDEARACIMGLLQRFEQG